jgi:hypothetical protein
MQAAPAGCTAGPAIAMTANNPARAAKDHMVIRIMRQSSAGCGREGNKYQKKTGPWHDVRIFQENVLINIVNDLLKVDQSLIIH